MRRAMDIGPSRSGIADRISAVSDHVWSIDEIIALLGDK
jgi:hypothetical protein